jgi:hypothetical protein
MSSLLLIHLTATIAMFGIIWFVQVVHYPLFARVQPEAFAAYENAHTRLTSYVVAPLMCVEAASGVLLLRFRPPGVPLSVVVAGVVLVGIIWLSTCLVQVPRHTVLSRGFDAEAQRELVATNWIRTAAWTARTGLVLWMVMQVTTAS